MTEGEKQMIEGEILKNGRTENEKKEIGEGSQKKKAKNGRNKVSKSEGRRIVWKTKECKL